MALATISAKLSASVGAYLSLLVTRKRKIAGWNGSKIRQSSVALRHISATHLMIQSLERLGYLKAKSRTVNITVSSGESDVATAVSSCRRKWYIRGLGMDIQITKEEGKQEKNSEESANVAKIGTDFRAWHDLIQIVGTRQPGKECKWAEKNAVQ